jgi:hypothetical protein
MRYVLLALMGLILAACVVEPMHVHDHYHHDHY